MTNREINNNRAIRIRKLAKQMEKDYVVTVEAYVKSNNEYKWLFSFEGGGANEVWASTLIKAKAKLKVDYGGSKYCVPNLNTLRKATHKSADAQSAALYGLTI